MRRLRQFTSSTFKALSIRNFRYYFFGNFVSNSGTWIHTIALGWLVLDLSHRSGVAVGIVLALQFLPVLLFGVWGGVVADRFEKRRVLIISQVFQGAIAGLLAALTIGGVVDLGMVYVLTFLFGLADAFAMPARQAFAPELVPAELIPNAVGLNAMGFNLARITGPAIAGVLIIAIGTGYCFLFNVFSYIAVIGALLLMNTGEMRTPQPLVRAKRQIRAGFGYLWHEPQLRSNLLLMVVVGTAAINFPVLLPLLATITFGGNAGTYSVMTIAMGIGAIVGSLVVARRTNTTTRLLLQAGMVFGIARIAGSVAPTLAVFLVVLVVMGGAMMTFLGTNFTIVQIAAEPQMRGRVLSVYNIAVMGTAPIGGPLIGWLSSVTNPPIALAVGGVTTMIALLVFTADIFGLMGTRGKKRGRPTRRVVGRWSVPAFASSLTSGTGSGGGEQKRVGGIGGKPVASTIHKDASSATPC